MLPAARPLVRARPPVFGLSLRITIRTEPHTPSIHPSKTRGRRLHRQRHELGKIRLRRFRPTLGWEHWGLKAHDSEDPMDDRFVALRTVETRPTSQPADGDALTPFLEGLTIEHGPIPLLGQFLLLADSAARRRDVRLYFSSMDELSDINKRNADSWRPILPHYDAAYGGIDRKS